MKTTPTLTPCPQAHEEHKRQKQSPQRGENQKRTPPPIGDTTNDITCNPKSDFAPSKETFSETSEASKKRGERRDQPEIHGWIFDKHTSWRLATELAHSVVAGLDANTQRLFFHLVICTELNVWDEGWTPVSSRLIHREIRGASWQDLTEVRYDGTALVEYTGYDRRGGLSREYRVCAAFMKDYRARLPSTAAEASEMVKTDLFTGKKTTRRCKTSLKNRSGTYIANKESPLGKVLRYFRKSVSVPFRKDRIEQHLDIRRQRVREAFDKWEASGTSRYTPAFEAYLASYKEGADDFDTRVDYERAFSGDRFTPLYADYQKKYFQWVNDTCCYRAVLAQGIEEAPELGPDVYTFKPAYTVQMSGRIGCLKGMLQSCSREMKYAGFEGIANLYNYDLKASQPTILLQRFEEAIADGAPGIDTSWLRSYLEDRDSKSEMARKVGISVDTWKTCLCALMMGACLPEDATKSRGDIAKTLREEVGADELAANYARLRDVLKPLKASLDAWHDYLIDDYLKRYGTNGRDGRGVTNETGMRFVPAGEKKLFKRKAKMAAFDLQGLESAFVHALTLLGEKYAYMVVQNEHDGLIVLGEIPQAAIEEAAQQVNLRNPIMVKKPFCDLPLVTDDMTAVQDFDPYATMRLHRSSAAEAHPQLSTERDMVADEWYDGHGEDDADKGLPIRRAA